MYYPIAERNEQLRVKGNLQRAVTVVVTDRMFLGIFKWNVVFECQKGISNGSMDFDNSKDFDGLVGLMNNENCSIILTSPVEITRIYCQ